MSYMASDQKWLWLQPFPNVAVVAVAVLAAVAAALFVVARAKLPPGPRTWPLIGNLHLLGDMPHQSLAKLAHKYGPLMSMRLGSSLYVVASTAETAKALLQTHDSAFASRPTIAATVHMLFDNTDLAFAPYGPYWKLIRRVCLNQIFHPKRLEPFAPIRLEEARNLLRNVNRSCGGQPVPVRLRLQEVANNIISRITLSKKYRELSSAGSAHDIIALIDETMLLLGVPNVGDFIPSLAWMDLQGCERRMKAVRRKVQQAMGEIIKERRSESRARSSLLPADRPREDLLDVLLATASGEQNGNSEVQITDDNITAVIMDMYLGGTGTIAITAEWALAELLLNPEVLKKAQEEIDRVVGRERLVEDADVEELPYLQAVVKETFRLHPVAPLLLPRESMQACTVNGYHLPARTRAYVNVYAVGRDPGTWGEPLVFRPERFVGSDVEEKGQHFQLLPFGGGRRRCVALELGLLNLRLFLARLLQAFEWSPANERLDMTELFGLNVMLAQPLTAHVSLRVSPALYM